MISESGGRKARLNRALHLMALSGFNVSLKSNFLQIVNKPTMRFSPLTCGQWVVVSLIIVVLLLMYLLPAFNTIHWVGSTDLEIDYLVLDNADGRPIPGATVEIHSEGGFYEEDKPQDFSLVTDL